MKQSISEICNAIRVNLFFCFINIIGFIAWSYGASKTSDLRYLQFMAAASGVCVSSFLWHCSLISTAIESLEQHEPTR
jgi:hypothetical protein